MTNTTTNAMTTSTTEVAPEGTTRTVAAYAAARPDAPLEKTTITRRAVGEHDIVIDIKFSGICHSDIHQVGEDWGSGIFPMVPGHEIAGVVRAVGPGVTRWQVGDRVGVGCFVDSCRECDNCRAGLQQYCTGQGGAVFTYNGVGHDGLPTYGGYSSELVVDEGTRCASPTTCRWTPPRRCCAPGSPCTRRSRTGARARAGRSRSWASAGSATWA